MNLYSNADAKSMGRLDRSRALYVTGIDDVMFCHYGLFVAGAESFESTMKMASIAIQEK